VIARRRIPAPIASIVLGTTTRATADVAYKWIQIAAGAPAGVIRAVASSSLGNGMPKRIEAGPSRHLRIHTTISGCRMKVLLQTTLYSKTSPRAYMPTTAPTVSATAAQWNKRRAFRASTGRAKTTQ
jgi:hypothetical protein